MKLKYKDTKEKFNVNGDNCSVMVADRTNTANHVKNVIKQITKGTDVVKNPATGNFGVQVKVNGKTVTIPTVTNIFEAIAFGNPPKGMQNIIIDFDHVDANQTRTTMYAVLGCVPKTMETA